MRQIKKILSILLIVSFLLSVTATAVTAEKTGNDRYNGMVADLQLRSLLISPCLILQEKLL
jgi:hypothetical protein